MRAVIQRVSNASVTIAGQEHAAIGHGLLILLGVAGTDSEADAAWLAAKIAGMRIFGDTEGKMNLSVADTGGDVLVISQFTLHADTKKGNRPSFIRAARPEQAIPLYENFVSQMAQQLGKPVKTGIFGADMKVALLNDGPVTIMMDSLNRDF